MSDRDNQDDSMTALPSRQVRRSEEHLFRELYETKFRLERLEQQFEEHRKAATEQAEKIMMALDKINTTLSEARGGWRMMLIIGTVIAGVGSAVAWVFSHFNIPIR